MSQVGPADPRNARAYQAALKRLKATHFTEWTQIHHEEREKLGLGRLGNTGQIREAQERIRILEEKLRQHGLEP